MTNRYTVRAIQQRLSEESWFVSPQPAMSTDRNASNRAPGKQNVMGSSPVKSGKAGSSQKATKNKTKRKRVTAGDVQPGKGGQASQWWEKVVLFH